MKRATIIAIIGIILALFIIFRFKERLFGRPAVVASTPSIPSTGAPVPATTSSAEPVITSSGGTDYPAPLVPNPATSVPNPTPSVPNREFRKERPRKIQVDQPQPQLTHSSGPTIDIARTRMRILENLDAFRTSHMAAENMLVAALARQEQTINDAPEVIAAASDALKDQRARLQEVEASERSAQTAASEELRRLLAEWPAEQTSASQADLVALHGLIAEVQDRQREFEESVARRAERDAAHDARIAELNRQKSPQQEFVQAPSQERRFTSPPAPPPAIAAGPSHTSSAPAKLRYGIIVDAFENKTENPTLGTDGTTLLTSQLLESSRLIVVPQTDLQLKALNERLRGTSGITAEGRQTTGRHQIAPAQLLVRGIITHFENTSTDQAGGLGIGKLRVSAGRRKIEVRVTLQIVDARTGALVAAKNFVGNTQKRALAVGANEPSAKMAEDADVRIAFEKALDEATPWIVNQLQNVPWRGSIVRADGGLIAINRGAREGVAVGDILLAGESDVLRDPDTGDVIDETLHQRARLRVITVTERTATCIALDGDDRIIAGMAIWYSDDR